MKRAERHKIKEDEFRTGVEHAAVVDADARRRGEDRRPRRRGAWPCWRVASSPGSPTGRSRRQRALSEAQTIFEAPVAADLPAGAERQPGGRSTRPPRRSTRRRRPPSTTSRSGTGRPPSASARATTPRWPPGARRHREGDARSSRSWPAVATATRSCPAWRASPSPSPTASAASSTRRSTPIGRSWTTPRRASRATTP